MRRRAAILACVALALACGGAPSEPGAVADAYFRALGRDPMRTLPLLAAAFHASHGLHVVTAGEAAALRSGATAPEAAPGEAALDRFQLGWLGVQARPGYREAAAALRVEPTPARVAGNRAEVAVRVRSAEGPPFEQRFTLARGADGAWRIEAIAQSGVVAANEMAAFVASPSERARRALEQRLKRR